MSYQAVPIVVDKTGATGYITGCRDLDGRLYVVLYDFESTPKAGRLYYSDTEGASWTAETWSTSIGATASDGCLSPTLMVSPDNVVWCGMASYDGTTKPTVVRRLSHDERWGQSGGFAGEFHQFATAAWTSVHFAMDSAHRSQGYYNIGCCGIDAGNTVRYGDFHLGASDESVNATGTCSDAHITATAGGVRWVAWIESATLWTSYKAALTGAWSARAQASAGGQTVSSVEDVTINPCTDSPGILYRADQGGAVHYLYQAEWDPATSSWVQERIWDGTNNRHYYPGCSMAYDRRGSEFIVALVDAGGLGRAQHCVHAYYSALGATTWAYEQLTDSGAVDVADSFALGQQCPAVNGFRPSVNYQGLVFWTFVSVAGGAGDQILYWLNYDTLNNPRGNYPTKFSNAVGEPYYREEETYAGASIALTGEAVAAFDYPLTLSVEQISESQIFQTSVATFEAGWKATIARFPSGRRRLEVETVPLNDTDHTTLRTFLLSRADDSTPFNFTLVDATVIEVVLVGDTLDFTLVGPDIYKARFVLLEVL